MDFFKLSNGDIVAEHNIATAFQVLTGNKACDKPRLYSKFLDRLSKIGHAERCCPTVLELAISGSMAYAWTLYRDQNGGTLADAKKAVESMLETVKK